MTERKRYTKQTYGTPYNHIKPRQCKYDGVRTLTVHHTNTNKDTSKTTHKECGKHKWLPMLKPYQCEYDLVRTLTVHRTDMIRPIKVSTRQNINGTPTRHTVHHTITIKPGNVSTMRAYTNGTAYKHDEEPSMRVRP